MRTLSTITGTQYGSEGKGHATDQTIRQALQNGQQVISVRVGGPNAGHCVIDPDNNHKYALRTIPVGAIHDVDCYLAPGSEINLTVLENEINELHQNDRQIKLTIDNQATLLTKTHIQEEKNSDLTARTGSTASGVGAARAARLWRKAFNFHQALKNPHTQQAIERLNLIAEQNGGWVKVHNPEPLQPTYWEHQTDQNLHVVVEGTQGYWLGLHAGHYPQSTSNNARPIDFLAMAGLNPWEWDFYPIGVTRTNPIRVAGNSGPLPGETNWDQLGQDAEYTTVTKKQRRVGTWDATATKLAMKRSGIARNVLTMADKVIPEIHGMQGPVTNEQLQNIPELWELITKTEQDTGTPVWMVTTSENTALILEKP